MQNNPVFYLYPAFNVWVLSNSNELAGSHMAGSSQPQHFFAAGCLFADFAIAVIFYPVKTFVHIIWVLPPSDIKFESKNQFRKYVKNYPKIR